MVPSGLRKIDSGDFVIQDTATKREIDLSRNWDTCFLPGQKIEMSMIFRWQTRKTNGCPNCGCQGAPKEVSDVECARCGVTFGRVIELGDSPNKTIAAPRKTSVKQHLLAVSYLESSSNLQGGCAPTAARPPQTAYDEEEDIRHCRRIIVVQRQRRKVWQSVPTKKELPGQRAELKVESVQLEGADIGGKTATVQNKFYDLSEDEGGADENVESAQSRTQSPKSNVIDPETFE